MTPARRPRRYVAPCAGCGSKDRTRATTAGLRTVSCKACGREIYKIPVATKTAPPGSPTGGGRKAPAR